MKPIILNLISVIRRFKLATILNILGLSVAFAAFIVIMIQLNYDYGFDKCHKDYDKIFRVEISIPLFSEKPVPLISRPIAERFFESSPYIVAGALSSHTISGMGENENFFHVENDAGDRNYFKEKIETISPGFLDVFTFDFVEGSGDALKTPGNIIIPLSLSRKLFGNESAIGKQIVHSQRGNQTVLGVYRDFPANTVVANCMYFAMKPDENKEAWGSHNYTAFFRVNDASNAPVLLENFMQNFDFKAVLGEAFFAVTTIDLNIRALADIHFTTDLLYDFGQKASKQTMLIFLAIALVIILIAAINFTNFSTALTPMRIKSLNTQRVLGARQSALRLAIVSEAVIISFISYLVALLLVSLFDGSPLAKLVDADLSITAQPLVVGGTTLVALFVGMFAGMYPSRYMTSFAPAVVLKGSFALSPKGKKLRNALISVQFAASFALIVGASFMYLQNRFMQNSDLGYDRDALITVDIGRIAENRDAFTNKIRAYSGVEEITYSSTILSSTDSYSKWVTGYKGEQILYQVLPVHHSFLKVMGIEVAEGRDFRQDDENKEGMWIFNKSAREQFNLELNSSLEGSRSGEIIGFIPDLKIASFRTAVEPTAFYVSKNVSGQLKCVYIKLKKGTNFREAMSYINATLAEYESNFPLEVRFFDEVLQRLYEKEMSLSSLISIFSLLAIFISIVGVFGLVVFDSECRRKEIGVRKVLGASTIGIINMFNKAYLKILLICFVVAAPIAWYVVTRWLENFAYKTPMHWWVYLLAFITVGIITASTVTFQSWRVANDNPINSIKTE